MTSRIRQEAEVCERMVLGSMLKAPDQIADLAQIISQQDFRGDPHQQIFRGMVMLNLDGKPVNPASLFDWLAIHAPATGITAGEIGDLWDLVGVGFEGEYYAERVREHSIFRQVEAIGRMMLREADRPSGTAEQVLEMAERRIFEISQQGSRSEVHDLPRSIGNAYDRIDARSEGEHIPGVQSGYLDLDQKIGAFANSSFVVIGARPSIGKTALAVNLARNAVLAGVPVFFVSLEQPYGELTDRLLLSESRVSSHRHRHCRLTADDVKRFRDAGDRLWGGKMWIDDVPVQGMLRIASNTRRFKARHNIGLVIIDYLQLIDPEKGRGNRQEEVAGISRRLKGLSRELQVPIIALAQLNRAAEDRLRPRLADLRESGGIEADADTVLLLHRPASNDRILEIDVAKQRNGPTGIVPLVFQKDCMRFENCAEHYQPDPYE